MISWRVVILENGYITGKKYQTVSTYQKVQAFIEVPKIFYMYIKWSGKVHYILYITYNYHTCSKI